MECFCWIYSGIGKRMDDALALLQLKDVAYHTQGMARITVLLEVLADI
jgi:hypothetical protein